MNKVTADEMRAAHQSRVTSIDYLFDDFDRLIQSPESVHRLRRFILDLAVRGKLTPQDSNDEPASELVKRIAADKARLVKAGKIRKSRTEPEFGKDFPFDLPRGWAWIPFGLLHYLVRGVTYSKSDVAETHTADYVAILRANNIGPNLSLSHDAPVFVKRERVAADQFLGSGDFMIALSSGSKNLVGKAAFVKEDFDEAFGGFCGAIRLFTPQVQDFVGVYLQSNLYRESISAGSRGIGINNLKKETLTNLALALPPLAEQRRIVTRVNELMALCNRLEAARAEREATRDRLATASLARLNAPDPDSATFHHDVAFALKNLGPLTTRPNQIKALRQTILNLAVRGKLVAHDLENEAVIKHHSGKPKCEGLPANWRRLRLEEFLSEDTRNGYSRKPDDVHDGIPILRISAGTTRIDGLVAEEEHKLISGVGPDIRAKYSLRPGDLLACRFNGNKKFVGRMKLFKDYLGIQPIYPDKLIRVRVEACEALPEFVRIAAESDLVREQVEPFCSTTVGNWGISASNVREQVELSVLRPSGIGVSAHQILERSYSPSHPALNNASSSQKSTN